MRNYKTIDGTLNDHVVQQITTHCENSLTSADEHAQTSESPNMATTTPSARRGAQTPQKQHAGSLELDPRPSAASIRPP
jgi:hypothetical protein